ncbi:MAG: proton-conducting transporter membrane subunit [Planctomycetota bacterium]|nr:proton-conducting transporter membrane subunit [Planctomycetota bacterium]
MNAFVVAPILILLAAGIVTQLAPVRWRRGIFVAGVTLHLVSAVFLFAQVEQSGPQAVHLGGWEAPLGIALVADLLAAVLVLLTALLGFAVTLALTRSSTHEDLRAGVPALVCFLLAGVDAAFLTADLFHLYVAFEILLLASFVLFVVGCDGERPRAAARYLLPAVLSSMLLLAGVGLLYGLTGTLSMTDAGARIAALGSTPAVGVVAAMLAVSFALKAAAFPVFAWLPASYPAVPSELAALFSGLLTKVGVYALVRVFTLVLPGELEWMGTLLLIVAGATMVFGVLGALAQWGMQRLLTFHVVSQVGYLLVGLGIGTVGALAATVYYLFHNSVAKTSLLLTTGQVRRRHGTDELRNLGGIARTDPWLAAFFLIAALGLAGIPPLSGFWAKLLVLDSAAEAGSWAILGVAAAVGVLTLLSMAKIWTTAFWGEGAEGRRAGTGLLALLPTFLLVLVVVGLGLFAGPALAIAERAAADLLDGTAYVDALRRAAP